MHNADNKENLKQFQLVKNAEFTKYFTSEFLNTQLRLRGRCSKQQTFWFSCYHTSSKQINANKCSSLSSDMKGVSCVKTRTSIVGDAIVQVHPAFQYLYGFSLSLVQVSVRKGESVPCQILKQNSWQSSNV